jgi:hypothetical protein
MLHILWTVYIFALEILRYLEVLYFVHFSHTFTALDVTKL